MITPDHDPRPDPHTRLAQAADTSATVFSSWPTQRWRITTRHTSAELRGYLDGDVDDLEQLAAALKPLGWVVIASPADIGYDPFRSSDG